VLPRFTMGAGHNNKDEGKMEEGFYNVMESG